MRLTVRGQWAVAVAIGVALIGTMWLASAVGYLMTGVAG